MDHIKNLYPTVDPQNTTQDKLNENTKNSKYGHKTLKDRIETLKLRLNFFEKCKSNRLIPKGFQRHFWLAYDVNNKEFVQLIQHECNVHASRLFDVFVHTLENYIINATI